MPHLDRPLLDDQYAPRTIRTIWHHANGADAVLESYFQANRNFRYKARAAFRKARRKHLMVTLGDFGTFASEEQLKVALIQRLGKCNLANAIALLLQVECFLDLANQELRLASARPKVATPVQQ